MEKIKLMIIGAQKAGTTSLNKYLAQHPKIFTHFSQEFGMFHDLDSYKKGFEFYYKNLVNEDVKLKPDKSVFVAKHVGLMDNHNLLLKLKEHNDDIKIVLILRNPVDRAFSGFWFCRKMGLEPYNKFEDAVFINDVSRFKGNLNFKRSCDYFQKSCYSQHVKQIFAIFPEQNIKILLFEEMINDLNKYLNELCAIIGLEHYDFDTSITYNERTESKSFFFAKLLAPKKSKYLRNIIPAKIRVGLRRKLKRINTKTSLTGNISMDPNTRDHLVKVFKNDVIRLERITQLPLKNYWPEFFI